MTCKSHEQTLSSDSFSRRFSLYLSGKIPVRAALILPLTILIVGTVSITGYLSYRNGQKAIKTLAVKINDEITKRTQERLSEFIEMPHQLNKIHGNAFALNQLDPDNTGGQELHYWRNIQLYKQISHSYFCNTKGDFVGARKLSDGSWGTMLGDKTTNDNKSYHYYSIDSSGKRTALLFSRPKKDARARPWYTSAVEGGEVVWSPVFSTIDSGILTIATSQPIYNETGVLQGVVASDISFSVINEYLNTIRVGGQSEIFIMERSGFIISSSTSAPNTKEENGQLQRLKASASEHDLVKASARLLENRFTDLNSVKKTEVLNFQIEDEMYFLQVRPYADEHGLDWLIVSVVSENEFMVQIKKGNRITLIIMLTALLLSGGAGVVLAEWFLRPIYQLNKSAIAIINGELDQTVDIARRDELGQLADAFNAMVRYTNSLLNDLKQNLSELQHEVDQRKQTEKILKERERILALAQEASHTGITDFDVQTGRIWVDDKFLEILNYTREEFLEIPDENMFHPDDRELVRSKLIRHLQGFTPVFASEHRMMTGSGQWRWMNTRGKVVEWDSNSRATRIVGTAQDITERKQAQQELEKVQRLKSIGALAGGIAHDFNNILTGVYGNISIAKDDLGTDHPGYIVLNEAELSMDRAIRLTGQLLTFAKGGVPVKENVSIGEIAEDVALFDLSGSNVKLLFKQAEALWRIRVDTGQMQQVFSNLVINARQAMPSGGRVFIILENEIITEQYQGTLTPGNYVKIMIRDEGDGIDPNDIDRIFDPFFSTKETGSGLGLATTYSVINRHGGFITAESEVGTGTTFIIYLPADV